MTGRDSSPGGSGVKPESWPMAYGATNRNSSRHDATDPCVLLTANGASVSQVLRDSSCRTRHSRQKVEMKSKHRLHTLGRKIPQRFDAVEDLPGRSQRGRRNLASMLALGNMVRTSM